MQILVGKEIGIPNLPLSQAGSVSIKKSGILARCKELREIP